MQSTPTHNGLSLSPLVFSDRLPTALSLLANSLAYARDVAGDPWDFAVSMPELASAGATLADCRWLACKGYVDARASAASRRRGRRQALAVSPSSWFVLTSLGHEFLQRLQRGDAPLAVAAALDRVPSPPASNRPRWGAELRELWVGTVLVKRFRVPAPNQEIILAVFEESGWPECIDDPLPPKPGLDPKRRLHDTINGLNRAQKPPLIHFYGNGNGSSIRWRLAVPH